MMILGAMAVLCAAILPTYYRAMQQSYIKRTMADMRRLGVALEERAAAIKSFSLGPMRPVPHATFHRVPFEEVERALGTTLPRLDAWDEPLRVYVGGYDQQGRAQSYLIRSLGKDRRADTSFYKSDRTKEPSADIVYANGNFIYYWEGI